MGVVTPVPSSVPAPEHLAPLAVLRGHLGSVTLLAWSPDGTVLASASGDFGANDGAVRLWHANGAALAALTGHSGRVTALAWSSGAHSTLAAGGADGTVRLWDASGSPVRTLTAPANPVFALAWSPDSETLATGATGNTPNGAASRPGVIPGIVRLWHLDGTLVTTLATQYTGGKFFNLAWSPDGSLLAGGAVDYHIWRSDSTPLGSTPGCPVCTPSWAFAWFPDSRHFATGDESGSLTVYNTQGQRMDRTKSGAGAIQYAAGVGMNEAIDQLAFAPGGQMLAIGARDAVRLVPATGDLAGFAALQPSRPPLAWAPRGEMIATGDVQPVVRVWRTDGTMVAVLDGCAGQVAALAWSPDGAILAAGSEGKDVCLWRAEKLVRQP
jgi:WD40 repeat protein